MKKVLILTNSIEGLYSFRNELIERFTQMKIMIFISAPNDSKAQYYIRQGISVINTPINRHGVNPFKDIMLLIRYRKLVKNINPDVILTYTIKPNIYGGYISRMLNKPYFVNITGLGSAVENKGLLQYLTLRLYKIALKDAQVVFYQNNENMNFMNAHNIKGKSMKLLPGSGVNLQRFSYIDYPNDNILNFLFIGRLMKEKGIDYYLNAAKIIKSKYPKTVFHVLGDYEDDYKLVIENYQINGYIEYHGRVDDVRLFHKISHCTIHPSYYPEGMSNVLLESSASGRPIITTNRSGCKEIIENNRNGFIVDIKNLEDLVDKIEKFINLTNDERRLMGIYGRNKVLNEFNRDLVVEAYINEIAKIGVI